jgi:hypothetical protein
MRRPKKKSPILFGALPPQAGEFPGRANPVQNSQTPRLQKIWSPQFKDGDRSPSRWQLDSLLTL